MFFSFNAPQYLFLLILIPLVWFIHFFTLNNRKKRALNFANFDAISRIEGIDFFSRNFMIPFLSSLIIVFLILSVSGMDVHFSPFKGSSFYSFIVSIDTSKSMSADDFYPNRLTASKESAINFVKETPIGTKIGIVSFSSFSYIEQEITENKNNLVSSFSQISLSEYGGTDIYEAIITSSNLLRGYKNKAIILMSDGQDNLGNADKIVNYANNQDIAIHVVAIGTKEGGMAEYAVSKLNENFLQNISEMTGGEYFSVEDSTELAISFSQILRLTKEKTSLNLSVYLLIFSLILFVIEFFFINTKYFNYI